MSAIFRIVLHGLRLIISIGETHIVVFTAVGYGNIIVLVHTRAEDVGPLVVVDRTIGTLSAIEIGDCFATIVGRTIRIDGGAGRSNGIAGTVFVNRSQARRRLIAVAQCPIVVARTELFLYLRHVGYFVESYTGIEINMGTSTTRGCFCCNHQYAVGCF